MGSKTSQRWTRTATGKLLDVSTNPYLLFLAIGTFWIILSDQALAAMHFPDSLLSMTGFQTAKGLLFVVITASAFYSIGLRSQRKLNDATNRLQGFSEIAKTSFDIVWRANAGSGAYEILHVSDAERYSQLYDDGVAAVHPDDFGDGGLPSHIKRHGLRAPFKADARMAIDGEYRHFEHWVFPVFSSSGELIEYYGTCRDVHDFVNAQERIQRDEHMLRMASEVGGVGIWEWNIPDNKLRLSNEVHRQYGSVVDNPTALKQYIHPEDYPAVREVMLSAKHHGLPFEIEYRVVTAGGHERWIHNKGAPVDRGEISRGESSKQMVGISLDISRIKQAEQRLRQLAFYDSATQLPNREKGQQQLEKIFGQTKFAGEWVALSMFDIDYFSSLNETYGPMVADEILKRIADSVVKASGVRDFVCRYGPDIFLVILTGCTETQFVEKVEVLESILHSELEISDMKLFVSITGSIACSDTDGDSASELVRAAQSALYHAKDQKRGKLVRFSPDMLSKSLRFEAIRNALKTAISNAELTVNFQPLYHMQKQSMRGFEALVRWNSASLGAVSPAEFIPIAERIGLIGEIDDFVLDAIADQIQEWQSHGLEVDAIGFNLSPRNLEADGGADRLHRKILSRGLEPSALLLEVTETAMIQDAIAVARNLEQLAAYGYLIAIDDFGTGYSSLENLHRFRIEKVKIDKSFTQAITMSERHANMVRSIINMAHAMNMEVVAEGVETEHQRECLSEWGCDILQGYLYSKPVNAEEAEKFMRAA